MPRPHPLLAALLALGLPSVTLHSAEQLTGYSLAGWTIGAGGTRSSSGDWSLVGTVGQPISARFESSPPAWALQAGFWNRLRDHRSLAPATLSLALSGRSASLSISLASLASSLAGSDPGHGLAKVDWVAGTSLLGGSLLIEDDILRYEAPAGRDSADVFTFSTVDPLGERVFHHLVLDLVWPLEVLSIVAEPKDAEHGVALLRVRFGGEPGLGYRVQASSDLLIWEEAGIYFGDARGEFEHQEPLTEPRRFFRAVAP